MPSAVATKNSDLPVSYSEFAVSGCEQLRAATSTSQSEITQVEAGRMRGRVKHASVAGLSIGLGTFSRGLISQGVYSDNRVTFGFLLNASGHGALGHGIGNIRIWAPGIEHLRRYYAGASFGAVSASIEDITHFFGPTSRFGDPSTWLSKNSNQTIWEASKTAGDVVRSAVFGLGRHARQLTPSEAEYWKRSIIEGVCYAVANSDRSDLFVSSARNLVRRAQDYLHNSGEVPIHISELSSALRVSRSALHRAFDDVLGIPPIAYLRRRRLCEARLMLRRGSENETTVTEVALKQGFSDLGRFAIYYRALFDEKPSETLRR